MSLDARTPVIIGAGQVNQRTTTEEGVDPVALMAQAVRRAAEPHVLRAVDSIRVVNLLSWRYRDPGRLLGAHIGAEPSSTIYSGVGGNVPQSLLNAACLDIQAGRTELVLLAGAETWRTRTRLRAESRRPDWPRQDDSVPVASGGGDVPMASAADERIGLDRPAFVYPLFEQAVRVDNGEGIQAHRERIGELWSRFSQVAAGNPHAWNRTHVEPKVIWQPSAANRMISWPYTKLLNSNNMVDQAAVVVLASAEAAARLRVARDRWLFPWSGTDAHDTFEIDRRLEYHRSPAIRIAGERALALAGTHIDDVELIDLYSCFPSAVQIAARELGLSLDDTSRPLTITGGLTFAGGPWNNYVMHSIATMAELLPARGPAVGLITANGGYLTKHSMGVYGTEPPSTPFQWEDVQATVDSEPVRQSAIGWAGTGEVETWTVPFTREGEAERMFLAVRTPDGSRALAVVTDPGQAAAGAKDDLAGATVRVSADGIAHLL